MVSDRTLSEGTGKNAGENGDDGGKNYCIGGCVEGVLHLFFFKKNLKKV